MRIEQLTELGVCAAISWGRRYSGRNVLVDGEDVYLRAGQMLVVAPGEEVRIKDANYGGDELREDGICAVVRTNIEDKDLGDYRLIS